MSHEATQGGQLMGSMHFCGWVVDKAMLEGWTVKPSQEF